MSLSDRDWSGFDRGYKNRECWYEAHDWLVKAGFVEGCNEYERFVMDRDGAHSQFLGQTGPYGSWYGGVERDDGSRRLLRGPKKGLRLFKTAKACLAALGRDIGGPPELLASFCAKHAPKTSGKGLTKASN